MTLCLPEIQMLPTLPDNSWLNGQTDAQNKSREATLFSHERWFSRWRRTLNATRATPFLGYYWIRFKNQNREHRRNFPQARDWLNAKPEVFCCKFPSTSKLAPQVEAPGPIFHIFTFNNTTQHTLNLWKKKGFVMPIGLLCHHTASNPITAEMHTSGVQNKEARKRLTESNGTPAMDLRHMNVVLK